MKHSIRTILGACFSTVTLLASVDAAARGNCFYPDPNHPTTWGPNNCTAQSVGLSQANQYVQNCVFSNIGQCELQYYVNLFTQPVLPGLPSYGALSWVPTNPGVNIWFYIEVTCSNGVKYHSANGTTAGYWPYDNVGTAWGTGGTTITNPTKPASSLWVFCPAFTTSTAAVGGAGF